MLDAGVGDGGEAAQPVADDDAVGVEKLRRPSRQLALAEARDHAQAQRQRVTVEALAQRGEERGLVGRAAPAGAAFVFLSPQLVRSATEEHRFPTARCHVMQNGISQNWFETPSRPYEARRIDAVFVGRWSAEKGVADLVALFSYPRLGERYCCHVYGAVKPDDGSCDGANLVFHGWVEPSEVEEAIRSAKLLFLPSYAEAYPTVLIEAAACGTPFVATEVVSIPDIAQQSKAGATAPPGDIDAMKAVLRFLNDQETWIEASRHGFGWARQQTTEKMVDEWRTLLSELAGR